MSLYAINVKGFLTAILNLFYQLPFMQHRTAVYLLQRLLIESLRYFTHKSSIRGCLLWFKGKISRRGGSRKIKLLIKMGQYRIQCDEERADWENHIIKTLAGAVGLHISLVYA
jgi:hypothetical protein